MSLVAAIIDLSTSHNTSGDREKQSKSKDSANLTRVQSIRMMKEQTKKLKPSVSICYLIDFY